MSLSLLRALSNYGLIVNAVFGIYGNFQLSLLFNVILSALCVPFYAKVKLWDTVAFITFMMAINLSGFLLGTPGCKPSA